MVFFIDFLSGFLSIFLAITRADSRAHESTYQWPSLHRRRALLGTAWRLLLSEGRPRLKKKTYWVSITIYLEEYTANCFTPLHLESTKIVLSQKRDSLRPISSRTTHFSKITNFLSAFAHPLHKLFERTASSGTRVAIRQGHNAIVDVDADEVAGLTAGFGFWPLPTGESFKTEPASHRQNSGHAPDAVCGDVCYGEMWIIFRVREDVKSSEHGSNVAVVDTTCTVGRRFQDQRAA